MPEVYLRGFVAGSGGRGTLCSAPGNSNGAGKYLKPRLAPLRQVR